MTKVLYKDIPKDVVILDENILFDKHESDVHVGRGPVHTIDFRRDSYVFVFTGRRGGGKTSLASLFAVKAARVDHGLKIVSNYNIEFCIRRSVSGNNHLDYYKSEPLDFERLLSFDSSYNGVLIIIDEAPDIISHLASQTWKNRLLATFTRQLRKNGNSLFLLAQDENLIDKSMRWQVDIVVDCEDASKRYGEAKFERGECILFKLYDQSGIWTGRSTQDRINANRYDSRWNHHYEHPWVMKGEGFPRVLWGDKAAGTKPVFDTYFTQDVWESLRKVDLKLSKGYTVGDGVGTNPDKTPVSSKVLLMALDAIETIMQNEGKSFYQTDFYSGLGGLSDVDKNNLAKKLGQYNVGKGMAGNNKRYYDFTDFDIEGFRVLVKGQMNNDQGGSEAAKNNLQEVAV